MFLRVRLETIFACFCLLPSPSDKVFCSVYCVLIIRVIPSGRKCQVWSGVAGLPIVLSVQLLLDWWSSSLFGSEFVVCQELCSDDRIRLYLSLLHMLVLP